MTEKEFLRHMLSKGAAASAVAILFTLSNYKECVAALSSKALDGRVARSDRKLKKYVPKRVTLYITSWSQGKLSSSLRCRGPG